MLKVPERTEIDGLIERWQKHREEGAFERLLEMHRRVIDREAHRFAWTGIEYDDLVAIAEQAFLRAVNKATPGNDSAKFATYCRPFIQGDIIDAKRRSDAADPTKGRGGEPDGEWVYLDEPPEPTDDGEDDKGAYELAADSPSPERVAIDRLDVEASLKLLSPKQRRVIEAIYFEDLTQFDAAQAIGIDPRHVQRLLKQALSIMRDA